MQRKERKDRRLTHEIGNQTASDVARAVVPGVAIVNAHERAATAYVHLKLVFDVPVSLHGGGGELAERVMAKVSRPQQRIVVGVIAVVVAATTSRRIMELVLAANGQQPVHHRHPGEMGSLVFLKRRKRKSRR